MEMKRILVLGTIILLFGTVQWLYGFPPECNGKQVTCEMFGGGTCTLMYCPGTITYDAKGNVIKITDDCNQCTFTRQCWCGGHSFTVTE
jgi:hypothetical protein